MVRRFEPGGPLRGTVGPPADKSITHRAILLAAMAEGRSRIEGGLDAGDTRSTLGAVGSLGAAVSAPQPGSLEITGVGLRGPAGKSGSIDCGNAGTLIRLLSGWLAGANGAMFKLDGDASLRSRPMARVAEPLRRMGARIELGEGDTPPVEIAGADLRGTDHELAIASAQVKSCLLLAGLGAAGPTSVLEPSRSRDHTERMLAASGAEIETETGGRGSRVVVEPVDRLAPLTLEVPGDPSSAAFLVVAALVIPGSEIRIENVGLNPTRTGFIEVLRRMGAEIDLEPGPDRAGEPAGAVLVRHSPLTATSVAGDEIPAAIDELPLIALAGAFAEGETVIRDASELRHKESDRIASVAAALRDLGAAVEEAADGLSISGAGGLRAGTVRACGDHRIAMLGAVAGLAIDGGVEVDGAEVAAISYPSFEGDLGQLLDRS